MSVNPSKLFPSPIVEKVLDYVHAGKAADLGCGSGRNSIFLAHNGFKVHAIDTHKGSLSVIDYVAELADLPITTEMVDVKTYEPSRTYDLTVSSMLYHFFDRDKILEVIKRWKHHTNPNGIHLVTAYLDKNPKKLRTYQFKENELKDLYSDWEPKYYKEYLSEPFGPHKDQVYRVDLIAQKSS